MDNLYRLFIKSETEYMHYKLGHIIDAEDVTDFKTAIAENKIKVYIRDESAMYNEAGTTFLDFAFAIHSEIKKGESSLPNNKDSGEKTLNVSSNNGDVNIEFVSKQ